ncbi:type II toxin-antitoxin system VapC family toxin [Acinetobacter puyangensis]|uniref:PIN domain nuclease, a component of toxin-antitoxin system (PIN domain) n=1 Tax=Acinetobacter puyangensis TaxID=1096779 RepID=A0A240E502_9GAMM|nr:type II toxin-antitoxin system VapC family toxin [Acinetobacter puyangensis]SNX43672.1 PIN domain nuclease, a component of toxin-antitoxin system (PIN domain) [Acinetobacter puyangensis]
MILLDTHVMIWMSQGIEGKIGKASYNLIETAWRDYTLAVSSMSFWEWSMLYHKGRVGVPNNSMIDTRKALLAQGLIELPMTGEIGILANELNMHGDPADRIILATASKHQAILVTADENILSFATTKVQDARQ